MSNYAYSYPKTSFVYNKQIMSIRVGFRVGIYTKVLLMYCIIENDMSQKNVIFCQKICNTISLYTNQIKIKWRSTVATHATMRRDCLMIYHFDFFMKFLQFVGCSLSRLNVYITVDRRHMRSVDIAHCVVIWIMEDELFSVIRDTTVFSVCCHFACVRCVFTFYLL